MLNRPDVSPGPPPSITWRIRAIASRPHRPSRRSSAHSAPQAPANLQALQAALTKALKAEPDAAKALEDMLKNAGAPMSAQTANVDGDFNKVGQASGGSSVTIG